MIEFLQAELSSAVTRVVFNSLYMGFQRVVTKADITHS